MADSNTYSKVAACEVDGEPEDGIETTGIRPNCPSPQSLLLRTLLIALVSFVAGFGVSSTWFPTVRYLNNCDAVSYGFLDSPKGRELQEELQTVWREEGPPAALQHMAELMEQDSQVASSCHPFLHQLGRMAWRERVDQNSSTAPKILQTAFSQFLGTPNENLMRTCNAAYMHGLIEDDLKTTDPTAIVEEASWIQDNLCSNFEPLQENALSNEWECQHGVGHGILQHQRVLLQRQALENALQNCAQSTTETESCQNGIWMDYWVYQGMTLDMDFQDPTTDPLDICFELDAINSLDCRLYAPSAYLLRHPHQYADAMKVMCGRRKDPFCARGVGMQTAKENMLDYAPVEQACLSAPTRPLQRKCFDQGVHYYKTASKSETIPSFLCENLTTFKQECKGNT